jgi:hypothetical protein
MGYLAILDENSKERGLYHFVSVSVRDEMGSYFEKPKFYFDSEKKKALAEMGLVEEDIRDGIELVHKFRDNGKSYKGPRYLVVENGPYQGVYLFKSLNVCNDFCKYFENCYVETDLSVVLRETGVKEEDIRDGGELMSQGVRRQLDKNISKVSTAVSEKSAVYLSLTDCPYSGIYFFNSEKVRNKMANNFANSVKYASKEEAMSETGVIESDIKDGGMLLKDDVRKYIDEHKPVKEKSKVSEKVVSNKNVLKEMVEIAAEGNNDVIEITMSDGETFRLAYRPFYYTQEGAKFENTAKMTTDGEVIIKEEAIEKLINNGDIFPVYPSGIEYMDGYAILTNCDDHYSPTIGTTPTGAYKIIHVINKMTINVNQVAYVRGYSKYSDICFEKFEAESHKIIVDYLDEKYGFKR